MRYEYRLQSHVIHNIFRDYLTSRLFIDQLRSIVSKGNYYLSRSYNIISFPQIYDDNIKLYIRAIDYKII